MDIRQKDLNVIALERGEFKLFLVGRTIIFHIWCKSYRRFCNRRGLTKLEISIWC